MNEKEVTKKPKLISKNWQKAKKVVALAKVFGQIKTQRLKDVMEDMESSLSSESLDEEVENTEQNEKINTQGSHRELLMKGTDSKGSAKDLDSKTEKNYLGIKEFPIIYVYF